MQKGVLINKQAQSSKQPCPEESLAQTTQELQTNHAGVVHPNFDPDQTPVNPDRPLTDLPPPAPRLQNTLQQILEVGDSDLQVIKLTQKSLLDALNQSKKAVLPDFSTASMWELIASPELASHLELLEVGGLIQLPKHFFKPVSSAANFNQIKALSHKESTRQVDKPAGHNTATEKRSELSTKEKNQVKHTSNQLLAPLTEMRLLDLSDIHKICLQFPSLTRYGFQASCSKYSEESDTTEVTNNSESLLPDLPELINDSFAPSWEVILYPERFDNHVDSLSTDILACSTAVHILKQCQNRKSVNKSVTAYQICQYMRSYVLSQCNIHPQFETQYRQIRLFTGHVVIAAKYLGFDVRFESMACSKQETEADSTVSPTNKNKADNIGQPIYINISTRSSLFTRYPNISNYYINGWS